MKKGLKSDGCKGCKIYSVCPISYIFNNIHCPCYWCLVKPMCMEECDIFHRYFVNYLGYTMKQRRNKDNMKYIVSEMDVIEMRKVRDVKR